MDDAHVAVLLKDLRSQSRVFGEALEGQGQRIDRVAKDHGEKLDRLAKDHGEKLDRLVDDVSARKSDMVEVKARLTRVEDRLDGARPPPRPRRPKRR